MAALQYQTHALTVLLFVRESHFSTSLCKRSTVILTIFYVFSFDFAHFGAQTEFFLDRIEKIMCNFLVEV